MLKQILRKLSWLMLIGCCVISTGCSLLSGSKNENELILSRLDLSRVEVAAKTLMMQAAETGDGVLLKQAFAKGDSINAFNSEGTAFSLALANGHISLAKILLAAGADWQLAYDQLGSSALIVAASQGFNDVVKKLLIREAEVNHIDAEGYSALARAAINGHLTTLKILINAGGEVDLYPGGRSILMHSVEDNNMLIAQILIAAGADVNYQDDNGDSALRIARRKGYFDLDLMLVQSGARP